MRWKPYVIASRDMSVAEAKKFLEEQQEGEYTLLDVRQPEEHEQARLPGGRLLPLPDLFDRIDLLDPEKPLIIYCRSGNRSGMAAQYLSARGFTEVYNLSGGIQAWQGGIAAGPMDFGMNLITGKESPAEILLLAYGMEEGLREFYERMRSSASHPPASNLFDRLAAIEVRHKEMVFELYREHDRHVESPRALEERVLPEVMEGGLTTDEILAENGHLLRSLQDIVAMAMTIEVQALDLYLRYAQRSEDPSTRDVLHRLGDEEKTHLALLGNLIAKL
jgi:rhodanese-related sulfurtransferase/rubrerythrin